jgi:hypothetical protein
VTGITKNPKYPHIFDVLTTEITTRAIIRDEPQEINKFTQSGNVARNSESIGNQ